VIIEKKFCFRVVPLYWGLVDIEVGVADIDMVVAGL
jgi:hypothetical protein